MAFDPSQAKPTYTMSEWQMKEQWYTDEVNKLTFSVAPTPAEVQAFAINLDKILTTARIDNAHITQTYDMYNMRRKWQEQALFNDVKQSNAGTKLTVDDIKSLVAKTLRDDPWPGGTRPLYDLVQTASARYIFMDSILRLLQDKKELLITHNGILKIESSLNSLQPSVPTTNRGYQPPLPDDYTDSREGGM